MNKIRTREYIFGQASESEAMSVSWLARGVPAVDYDSIV